jgi:hypothetical protein
MPLVNEEVGPYRVIIYSDSHELYSADCLPSWVQYRDQPHLNVKLYENGDEVYNAHVGSYESNGQICVFYWDSVSDYCDRRCFDKGDFSLSAAEAFLMDAVDQAEANGAEVLGGIGTAALVYLIITAWAVPVVPPAPP